MSVFQLRLATIAAAMLVVGAVSVPVRGENPGLAYFTAQQARNGSHAYTTYCATCHGVDLRGPQLPLQGPAFWSLGKDTGMTLGQFFNFIVRDTPAGSLDSLSHDQYVSIMAFIMQKNGYSSGVEPLHFEQALHLKARIGEPSTTAAR